MLKFLFSFCAIFILNQFLHADPGDDLYNAVKNNDIAVIKTALKNGTDINQKYGYSRTALMLACVWNHKEVVEFLISNGTNVNARDEVGLTALMLSQNVDIVSMLISKRADVNAICPDGGTVLMDACESNEIEIAELLISKGADVNARSDDKSTALIIACRQGYKRLAELLISKGADVDAADKKNNTALSWARDLGHDELAKFLITKGAKSLKDDLFNTIFFGDLEGVKAALQNGADVNSKSVDDKSALIWACMKQNKAIVQLLISKGAEVNAKDIYGWNALIWYILNSEKDDTDIPVLLLESRIDVNVKWGKFENTALSEAECRGFDKISELLKKYGAKEPENL